MAAGITFCLRLSLGVVAVLAVINVGHISFDIAQSSADIGLKIHKQRPSRMSAGQGGPGTLQTVDGGRQSWERTGGDLKWPSPLQQDSQASLALRTEPTLMSAAGSLSGPGRGSVMALPSPIRGAMLERPPAYVAVPGRPGGNLPRSDVGLGSAASTSLMALHASSTTSKFLVTSAGEPAVSAQADPPLRRLTKWPKGDINTHKLPTILVLGCVKKGCKPKKISCLEDITNKRLGNTMVSVINSIWLADAHRVSIKVSGLNKPGIVNLPERVGPPDKSCPKKTLPQNEIKLLFWPWHRSANKILCQNCIVPSPGAGWEAGLKARSYMDLDDSPAVANTTLVIHMRGEDIFDPNLKKQHPWFVQPPCSWYPFIIRKHAYRKVLIVSSDDGNNPWSGRPLCLELCPLLCRRK